jgi:hypothetical protein
MVLSVDVLLGLLMPAAQPQKVTADQTPSWGGAALAFRINLVLQHNRALHKLYQVIAQGVIQLQYFSNFFTDGEVQGNGGGQEVVT